MKPGMLVHACSPTTWERAAGGSRVQGQPEIHSETMSEKNKGWGYSSVVECLPSMDSVHSTAKKKTILYRIILEL
jgi:hypothetical protein